MKSFGTDNDEKKMRNVFLKGFYKSSRTFASEQGRQTPKINKRRVPQTLRGGRWG